jgi:uncharacterized protein YecE (DUF72 family)
MSVDWRLGTMGFSYKDWSGVFYPDGLAPRDYLAYYSQFFDTVELDSTFYGTPHPEYVARWASLTPPNFVFCAKTPKQITHEMRLVDTRDEMDHFVDTMRLLGDKLAVVLIQLPPDMTFEYIHKLALFLRDLPPGARYAVEFRHASWHATATGQLLQNHRVAWVSTDYIHLPRRVYATTDFLYIRWIGRHGQYETKDYERIDPTPWLEEWLADIQSRLDSVHTCYGYFNNDYAGHSPATCNRFRQMVGLPTRDLQPPQQGRLL